MKGGYIMKIQSASDLRELLNNKIKARESRERIAAAKAEKEELAKAIAFEKKKEQKIESSATNFIAKQVVKQMKLAVANEQPHFELVAPREIDVYDRIVHKLKSSGYNIKTYQVVINSVLESVIHVQF